MTIPMHSTLNRRSFLGTTTLLGAGLAASSVFAAVPTPLAGAKKIKVGLIGCGGRGNGALGNFIAACKILGIEAELVATGDAFQANAEAAGKKLGLAAERCFGGYDAYQKVLATDCDFVVMATPPAFRPVHLAAAVEAGKHCFIEKPVAVDPVGARSIIATGEKAKAKGLGIVAGTQRRHQGDYLRNKALIDAGAIGQIRGGIIQWNGTVPWIKRRKDGESDASYMTRNWLNFTELSGDHIVEQHVHNLDVAVWFLGRLPIAAVGFGGRARRETGNMFDFFSIDYDFGDDVHIHSQCRQLAGTYQHIGEMFTGTEGSCYGGGKMNGKKVDVAEIILDTKEPYVQEHVDLIRRHGRQAAQRGATSRRVHPGRNHGPHFRLHRRTGALERPDQERASAALPSGLRACRRRLRKGSHRAAQGRTPGSRQGLNLKGSKV